MCVCGGVWSEQECASAELKSLSSNNSSEPQGQCGVEKGLVERSGCGREARSKLCLCRSWLAKEGENAERQCVPNPKLFAAGGWAASCLTHGGTRSVMTRGVVTYRWGSRVRNSAMQAAWKNLGRKR